LKEVKENHLVACTFIPSGIEGLET